MSGPSMFGKSRRWRRGATLTLVFSAVLASGAAAGSLTDPATQARRTTGSRIAADPVASAGPSRSADPAGRDGAAADDGKDEGHGGVPGAGAGEAAGPRGADPADDTGRIAAEIADGAAGAAAVEKMVSRSGDRWSSFYTAQEYAGLQQALDGRYVGVGVSVRRIDGGRIQVAGVQAGSPAARAGLRPGDILTAIGATGCTGLPVTEVVADLRGDSVPGSPVTLRVQRGALDLRVAVRRATLATDSVTVVRHEDGPTVVTVAAFTRGAGRQVRDAVRGSAHGVLLDLRGNSGGLVTEAVATASAFLDGGLVATYDVHGQQRALYASPGGNTTAPLVVLVDGGTMSAAEMLSGALQERGRALVIGSRTFGKGSVQMPSTLADGSVAELTVGHYRLPDGRSLDGVGLVPDVVVPVGEDPLADSREVFAGLGAPS